MTEYEKIKSALDLLTHGEFHYFAFGEESGAEVYLLHGFYIIFEYPRFGGKPVYVSMHGNVHDATDAVNNIR